MAIDFVEPPALRAGLDRAVLGLVRVGTGAVGERLRTFLTEDASQRLLADAGWVDFHRVPVSEVAPGMTTGVTFATARAIHPL